MVFTVNILTQIAGKGGFKIEFGSGYCRVGSGAASTTEKVLSDNFFISCRVMVN
jgi:hypothetical protein